MATRTISTKLAIEGESTYRAALRNCNTELKTLRSELGYTEEKYRTNANTLDALQNKVKALTDVYEKQGEKVKTLEDALGNSRNAYERYSKQVEEAGAKVKEYEESLEEMRNTTGDTSAEQKEATEELEKWKDALQDAEEYQEAAKRGVENWQTQLNGAKTEQLRLNEELEKSRQYLSEASWSADQCARSIDEYGNEVKEAGEESERFGDKSKEAIDQLASALAAAGVAKSVEEIARVLRDCADAAVDFESAMAGVSKTTELSDQELAKMSDAIQGMATRIPATTTEIAGVVEAAGQLGIAKGDLLDFAEVMVNLGTSTNLSSEEAASSLAKFANVVKMEPENYERLGSTIVDLGNNFATTESDIVSMATRLASTGEIVGLSEPQIMAVATALSSVGIEAEAGGSAVSKLLKQMETAVQTYGKATQTIESTGYSRRELELMASNESSAFKGLAADLGLTTSELKNYMANAKDLESFAEVSGMAAQDFIRAWGTDAVGALGDFITGLGEIDAAGGSSVAVLQDMGITEIRLSNAVQAMASSNGILERALNTANNAWEQNSALAQEAATRYETTESKLQMAKNAAENLKIAVGNELLPVIGDLADAGSTAFSWAADFVEDNPWIVGAITGLATALGTLAIGVGGLAAAPAIIGALNTALGLLAAHPFVLIAAGVAGLAAAIATLSSDAEPVGPKLEEVADAALGVSDAIAESKKTLEDTNTSIEATADVAETYIRKLEELDEGTEATNEHSQTYMNTLRLLCDAVPELTEYIDLQTGAIKGGTKALRDHVDAWKKDAEQAAYQEHMNTLYEQYNDVMREAAENSIKLTEATIQREDAEKKAAETTERLNQLQKEAEEEARRRWDQGQSAQWYDLLTDEYYQLRDSLYEYEQEVGRAKIEEEAYTKALELGKEAQSEAEDAINRSQEAIDKLTGATQDGTGALEDNTGALDDNAQAAEENAEAMEALKEMVARLEEQYNATAEEARQSIQRQIDYFGELDENGRTTIQDIIKNLEDQAKAMEEYADNITLAMERGVDYGIIKKLSDGSEKSAAILAAMVAGTEDEIQQLNATYGLAEEGITDVGEAMAEVERQNALALEGINEDWEDFVESTNFHDEMYENARDTVQGGIDGVYSMVDSFKRAMVDVGLAGQSAFKGIQKINSPSKVYAEYGRDTVEGVIVGVEEKEREFEEAYKKLAEKAILAYETAIPSEDKLPGAKNAPLLPAAQTANDVQTILLKLGQLTSATRGSAGNPAIGQSPSDNGGIDTDTLAEAVAKALDGVGVYVSERKIGQLYTKYRANNIRARGADPVPG